MRSRHPDREFDKKDSSPLLFCPLRRIPGLSLYVSVRNCLCLSPLLSDGWMEHGAWSWSCIGRGGGLVVNPERSLTNPIHAMPEYKLDMI